MAELSSMELNAIREMVSSHQLCAKKLSDYANQCQDQTIKQMFQKASTEATSSAQKLINML